MTDVLGAVRSRSLEEGYAAFIRGEEDRIVKQMSDLFGKGGLTPDQAMGAWGAIYHLRRISRTLRQATLEQIQLIEDENNER